MVDPTRPEASLTVEPDDRFPDQLRIRVRSANGVLISTWPTLYNDKRNAERAIALVAAALDDYYEAHPGAAEVVTYNQDDPA